MGVRQADNGTQNPTTPRGAHVIYDVGGRSPPDWPCASPEPPAGAAGTGGAQGRTLPGTPVLALRFFAHWRSAALRACTQRNHGPGARMRQKAAARPLAPRGRSRRPRSPGGGCGWGPRRPAQGTLRIVEHCCWRWYHHRQQQVEQCAVDCAGVADHGARKCAHGRQLSSRGLPHMAETAGGPPHSGRILGPSHGPKIFSTLCGQKSGPE